MSEFFKALEQAEHDRAVQQSRRSADKPTTEEAAPAAPPPRASSVRTEEPLRAPRAAAEASREPRTRTQEPPAPVRPAPTADPRAFRDQWATGGANGAHAEQAWGEIEEHLVSLLDPTSPDAEQYRALRHVVEQSQNGGGRSVLAVSSPTVGDGKTTTAINMAGALAQDRDAAVLLIDADLRRGTAGARLGLRNSRDAGLVDAILDPSLTLESVVRYRAPFNLSVLPAGRLPSSPYEVLKSPRLGQLIDEARRRYDFVVLDTPPIVVAQDCRVISKWVDGFLFVVAADRTPARLVEEALNRMEPGKIIGFVFNHEARSLSHYYAGRYAAAGHRHTGEGWRQAVTKAAGSVRQRFAL